MQTGHLEGKTLRYLAPDSPTQLQSRVPCSSEPPTDRQEAFPGPKEHIAPAAHSDAESALSDGTQKGLGVFVHLTI